MQQTLDQIIWGNTVLSYLTVSGYIVAGLFAVYLFRHAVLGRIRRWAERTESVVDDVLLGTADQSLVPALYLGVIYLSLDTLSWAPRAERIFEGALVVLVTVLLARALTSALNQWIQVRLRNAEDITGGEKQLKGMRGLINFALWTAALLFMLDNLGVRISAVVAGLGIGGIAVALAAQAVLGDLFSYFVIFFDRPFEVGDFIVIDDKMGNVESIGIKTTRIRSLGGELLVFSNTDLTNSRVHNFKKMERRRVVLNVGVTYQTSAAQLKAIPAMVKQLIEALPGVTFERAHFAGYGDFSLNFEIVYYVIGADYTLFMDKQEAVNLAVFEAFTATGIEFAYPTQTLFVNKSAAS